MSSLWSSFSGGITPFSSLIKYLENPSTEICPVKQFGKFAYSVSMDYI